MKEFLTIQEVAEWLGVSDKTVSRLVLSGQLPATKVGGLYRLRHADIQEYLEKQKLLLQSRTRPPEGPPLQASVERAGPAAPAVSCARCGRLVKGLAQRGGDCQEPDCRLPLCRTCWSNDYDRYCRQHRRSREQKLEMARLRHARGEIPLAVTAEEARQREFTFIERFEQKIEETPYLTGPLDGVKYPVASWDAIRLRSRELDEARLARLRLVQPELSPDLLPQNLGSCYNLPKPRSRTERRGAMLSICASVFSDLEEMAANGFSASLTGRAFLLKILEDRAAANKATDSFTVQGLASPVGWTREAAEMIEGGNGTTSFSSLYIAVCLIDLGAGRLFFNPTDTRLKPFIPLFLGELYYETVQKIAGQVRERLAQSRSIMTLKDVAEKLGVEESTVKEACLLLEKEGGFQMETFPGFGLTISRKS